MSSAEYLYINDQPAETPLEVGGELPPDAGCQSTADTIAVVSFGSIFIPPLLWDILSNLFRMNAESSPSK
jgi:hypothetical protein